MTRKQMEAAREEIMKARKANGYTDWPGDTWQIHEEISCREMINSCVVYGGIENFWRFYSGDYVRELGRKRVEELVNEQMADFQNATIIKDTYTDCDGLKYNSVRWADD